MKQKPPAHHACLWPGTLFLAVWGGMMLILALGGEKEIWSPWFGDERILAILPIGIVLTAMFIIYVFLQGAKRARKDRERREDKP